MKKHTRFLILLLALIFFSALILLVWQRPVLSASVFKNPFLNLLTAFVISLVPIAAAVLILTLALSEREHRTAYLRLSALDGSFGAVKWLRIPSGLNWSGAGWIAALLPAGLTVVMKLFSLPGTVVFSLSAAELAATLGLSAVYAFMFEILYRCALVTVGKSAGVKDGGLIVFCVIFSGLAGYYFPLLGGPFGLLIGLLQGFLSAKAMIETGGIFWSWLIHFAQVLTMMIFSAAV